MIAFIVYAAIAVIIYPFAIKFILTFMEEHDLLFNDGMDTASGVFFGFIVTILWPMVLVGVIGFKISKLIGSKEEDK